MAFLIILLRRKEVVGIVQEAVENQNIPGIFLGREIFVPGIILS